MEPEKLDFCTSSLLTKEEENQHLPTHQTLFLFPRQGWVLLSNAGEDVLIRQHLGSEYTSDAAQHLSVANDFYLGWTDGKHLYEGLMGVPVTTPHQEVTQGTQIFWHDLGIPCFLGHHFFF